MTTSPTREDAKSAAFHLSDDVSDIVVRQGEMRLQAVQTAAHALDARVTQAATLQFTAAAVAGGLLGSTGAAPIAALSAIAFAIGGVVAFRGVRSDPMHLPGLPPAWWADALDVDTPEKRFSVRDARNWLAGYLQEAIDLAEAENDRRARSLNLSLRWAIAGAALAAAAVLPRVFT